MPRQEGGCAATGQAEVSVAPTPARPTPGRASCSSTTRTVARARAGAGRPHGVRGSLAHGLLDTAVTCEAKACTAAQHAMDMTHVVCRNALMVALPGATFSPEWGDGQA